MLPFLIAYKTLVKKEILRFFRVWVQVFLPNIITTALYLMIFGHVLGKHIGLVDGIPYMTYIAPGLIILAMINSAFSASAFSLFSSKFQRTFEEIQVSPMPTSLILSAFLTVGILRGLISATMVGLVVYFFTGLHVHSLFLSILLVTISSALFSSLGLINAIYAKNFEQISMIPNFILTPLTYLGGVFYAVSALPPIWQKISLVNPVFYIINGFRYTLLNTPTHMLGESMLILTLLTVALLWFASRLFHSRFGMKS